MTRQLVWAGALALAAGSVGTTGCSTSDAAKHAAPPAAGKITAGTTNPADTDVAAQGGALPKGYVAQFDRAGARPADVSYTQREPGRWAVRTGPAHILYQPGDTASGTYRASATFEQLDAPAHPEGFGVFVGGSKLADPAAQRYTYFLVRGDGTYLVKVRNGTQVRTITDWTPHANIPKQDAQGHALYGIRIDVAGKTARVSVNGAPVTTLSAANGPLDGIAGVRINHNLHVIVTPVSITR